MKIRNYFNLLISNVKTTETLIIALFKVHLLLRIFISIFPKIQKEIKKDNFFPTEDCFSAHCSITDGYFWRNSALWDLKSLHSTWITATMLLHP